MVIKLSPRLLLLCFATLFVLVSVTYLLFFSQEETAAVFPIQDCIIVLDAGHGGLDGGAVSEAGLKEKDANLKIAQYLEGYLKKSGAKVIMTRTADVSLHTTENAAVKQKKREDLLKRREIANTSGADFMISIHLNQFSQAQYKGAQVFYEPNFAESHALATAIQKSMRENLNTENKRTEQPIAKGKLQFQNLSVPSVLVECGFLSNKEEARLLADSDYQRKVALAIYLGVLQFYTL